MSLSPGDYSSFLTFRGWLTLKAMGGVANFRAKSRKDLCLWPNKLSLKIIKKDKLW